MNIKTKSLCCILAGTTLMVCCFVVLAPVWGQADPSNETISSPQNNPPSDSSYVNSATTAPGSNASGESSDSKRYYDQDRPSRSYYGYGFKNLNKNKGSSTAPSTNADRPAGEEQFYQIRDSELQLRTTDWPVQSSYYAKTKNGGVTPEVWKVQQATQQAIKKYQAGKTEKEKKRAEGEVKSSLSIYFDYDMKFREQDIAKIETRLKNLRTRLEKRRAAKEQLVELQVQLLINEANGLGFYGQPNAQSSNRMVWGTSVEHGPGLYVVPPRREPQVDGSDSILRLDVDVER